MTNYCPIEMSDKMTSAKSITSAKCLSAKSLLQVMIKLIFQIYRRRGLLRAAVNHAEKDRE